MNARIVVNKTIKLNKKDHCLSCSLYKIQIIFKSLNIRNNYIEYFFKD